MSPQRSDEPDQTATSVAIHERNRRNENALSSPSFPKFDSVIETSTSNPPSIRRESNMIDLLLMTHQPRNRFLRILRRERRPEEKGVIVRSGDDEFRLRGGELLVACEGERLG